MNYLHQALDICGYAFVASLFFPQLRKVYDYTDKLRSMFSGPTADQIADAIIAKQRQV